ncbi:hypothetical protein BX661DRAFT_186569 [Kickxella alabastrina]|uniref:uncharacterized protein n=1 Tax=Kickxella alabastrina TaxID=61397 RepID=UPI002220A7B3|nr:uncharacterized protein BX661DRAFT_186569 [Kickxella alabastrina]KAI7823423.1 hypothetical protein BX661DRAFT_186569 [Kickxella alabastrina]
MALKKRNILFSPKRSSVYTLVDNFSGLTPELNPEISKCMTNFSNQTIQHAAIETANSSPVMLSEQIGYRALAPTPTTAISTASTSTFTSASASASASALVTASAFKLKREESPFMRAQYTLPVKNFKKLENHKIAMSKSDTLHEQYYNEDQPLPMSHPRFINPEVGYINSSNMHPYLQQMQQMQQIQQPPTGHGSLMSTQVFLPLSGMSGLSPDNYSNHNQVYQGRYEDPKY